MGMKKIIAGFVLVVSCGVCFAQQARVAVAPFTATSGNATSDAETIAEIFGLELQAKNVVRVYTRGNILSVMNENRFQMSDLSSDEKTASIGKAANAEWVVRGQVQKLGTLIVVTASLLDVNTLEIMAGAPMYLNTIEEAATKMDGFISTITERISGEGKTVVLKADDTAIEYKVGDIGPAGGMVFYDKGTFSGGWRYMETALVETEFTAQWGAAGKSVNGTTTGIGAGKQNTETIIRFLRSIGENGKATQLCNSLAVADFDDWFLPSKDELDLMYKNLKTRGLGGFSDSRYWSSSEANIDYVWDQRFRDGAQNASYKYNTFSVRAIRAF
jgi:TolB-like protein